MDFSASLLRTAVQGGACIWWGLKGGMAESSACGNLSIELSLLRIFSITENPRRTMNLCFLEFAIQHIIQLSWRDCQAPLPLAIKKLSKYRSWHALSVRFMETRKGSETEINHTGGNLRTYWETRGILKGGRKKKTLLYSLSGPSIFEELRLMCNVGGHCILGREEAQTNRRNLIFNFFLVFLCCCCCSVAQLCLTLCDPIDCSMQASLSFTITQSLLKLMSIELVMPSIHLSLCHPRLLLPSIFPSIRVFSSVSALHIRWPKDWSFSISPSKEYSGLISLRMDWFDPLVVQRMNQSMHE